MNLLARILSHGFAFAVVALIILVLIYRGDLFEEWDLPDFLAIKDKPVVTDDSGAGAVDREPAALTATGDDAAASSAPVAATAEPEPAEPDTAEAEEIPAADMAPADVTGTATDTAPPAEVTGTAPAEPTGMVPAEATGTAPAEATDTAPADTDAEPAPEPAAVAEPVPLVAIEVVDTGAAAPLAADAEVAMPEEAGDDESAVTAPATGEGAQPAPVAAIEDSQDTASAPSVEAAGIPSEPAASAAASAMTDVAEEQAAAEPVETMAAPAAVEAAAPTAAADDTTAVTDTQAAPADVEPATTDTATADSSEPETPYNVLAKAREAYWLRDFATAEQQYKKLTQLEPANPDGYGELGNMYFSRGMWDEAANAYYEAGVRLLDEGLIVQARQMVDVIRGLNGNQADELDAQINTATTSSP